MEIEKTKIMRFKIGVEKMTRAEWKLREKEVEEVKDLQDITENS